jgi:hypothetical protein
MTINHVFIIIMIIIIMCLKLHKWHKNMMHGITSLSLNNLLLNVIVMDSMFWHNVGCVEHDLIHIFS